MNAIKLNFNCMKQIICWTLFLVILIVLLLIGGVFFLYRFNTDDFTIPGNWFEQKTGFTRLVDRNDW